MLRAQVRSVLGAMHRHRVTRVVRGQLAAVVCVSIAPLVAAIALFAPLASARADREATAPRPTSAAPLDDSAAVDAYRRGDLALARDLWSSYLESGRESLPPAERARVAYNLGNTAFRRGETMEAVAWYTASLRLRPRDGDTWTNLEHARGEAKLDPADRGDLDATMRRLLSSLTSGESEWLVLASLALWGALLFGEALRGGAVWRRLAIAGVLLVLVASAPWIYHETQSGSDPVLVVGAVTPPGPVDVRSEPRADATVIGSAAKGSEVERVDALGDWTKVRLENGTTGWVTARTVFALAR